MLAPERNREHSIGDQVVIFNVGFMERLHSYRDPCNVGNSSREVLAAAKKTGMSD